MREDYEDFFAYQDDKKATVNVGEAAELLGLHPNTVYKYIPVSYTHLDVYKRQC